MQQYLLLKHYRGGPEPHRPVPPMDQWAPEDVEAHMAFLRHVSELLEENGEYVDGQALTPERTWVRYGGPDAAPVTTDGPLPETSDLVAANALEQRLDRGHVPRLRTLGQQRQKLAALRRPVALLRRQTRLINQPAHRVGPAQTPRLRDHVQPLKLFAHQPNRKVSAHRCVTRPRAVFFATSCSGDRSERPDKKMVPPAAFRVLAWHLKHSGPRSGAMTDSQLGF